MRKRSRLGATDGEYSSGSDDEYEGDGAHAGRSAVPSVSSSSPERDLQLASEPTIDDLLDDEWIMEAAEAMGGGAPPPSPSASSRLGDDDEAATEARSRSGSLLGAPLADFAVPGAGGRAAADASAPLVKAEPAPFVKAEPASAAPRDAAAWAGAAAARADDGLLSHVKVRGRGRPRGPEFGARRRRRRRRG